MNRLYFVRHGEGQDNVARQYSSKHLGRPLTPRGVLQAQQTAAFLARKSIDEIYSSPIKRAVETAQIITTSQGKQLTIMDNFREVDEGDLDGQSFSAENWKYYHRIRDEWFAGNAQISFSGGENYADVWERWKDGLLQILTGKTGRDILLVGHSGIFITTLKDLCTDLDVNWLKNAECYNCSITELDIDVLTGTPRGRLITWSTYEHLGGDALHLVPGIPLAELFQNTLT
jgi:2,3-bisphosphoglycerate-dependent phosphoglycerate mutase